jgi:hypothetical protein
MQNVESQEKNSKRSVKQRTQDFLAGLGIIGASAATLANQNNVDNFYGNYVYPNFKNSNRKATALATDPTYRTIGAPVPIHMENDTSIGHQIISDTIVNQLMAADKLYPGSVAPARTWIISVPEQKSSSVSINSKQKTATVLIAKNAGNFSLAHELGHATSFNEDANSLAKKVHQLGSKIKKNEKLQKSILNMSEISAGLLGATSNSVLEAAGKGAAIGAISNVHRLLPEVAATRRGLKIMKEAGLPSQYGTGIAQVGGYLTNAILAPAALSAGAYGIKKTTQALMAKAKEKKQTKQQTQEVGQNWMETH